MCLELACVRGEECDFNFGAEIKSEFSFRKMHTSSHLTVEHGL